METVCTASGTKRPWWDPCCYRNVVIWKVLCLLREALSEQTNVVLLFCNAQLALSLALRSLCCDVVFKGLLGTGRCSSRKYPEVGSVSAGDGSSDLHGSFSSAGLDLPGSSRR